MSGRKVPSLPSGVGDILWSPLSSDIFGGRFSRGESSFVMRSSAVRGLLDLGIDRSRRSGGYRTRCPNDTLPVPKRRVRWPRVALSLTQPSVVAWILLTLAVSLARGQCPSAYSCNFYCPSDTSCHCQDSVYLDVRHPLTSTLRRHADRHVGEPAIFVVRHLCCAGWLVLGGAGGL